MAERRNSSTELLLALTAACTTVVLARAFDAESRDSIPALLQRSAMSPADAFVRGRLVDKLVKAGRSGEALELLRQRIAVDPDDVGAQRGYARLLVQAGRIPEAITSLRALRERHPEDLASQEWLADLLCGAGESEKAELLYKEIIAKSPDNVTAPYGLAQVYVSKGDALTAQRTLEESLKRHPDDPATNELLADLAVHSIGDAAYPIVQKYYERALKGDPARSRAALGLSKIYVQQRRYEDAARVLAWPAKLDRKNAPLLLQYADVLAALRRFPEAAAQYDGGTVADPANADAFCRWGAMLVDFGKPVPAELRIRTALHINDAAKVRTPQLNTRSAEYHMQLARALRDQALSGQGSSFADSIAEFKAALDRDPVYVPVYLELAQTYQDARNEVSAENYLRDALKIEPTNTLAKVRLAKILLNSLDSARNRRDEGLALLAQAVFETHSQDISLLVGFANALAGNHQYDIAIEQMDVAIVNAQKMGLVPWQIERLEEIRQTFHMATLTRSENDSALFTIDGRVIRDPADEPWPDPGQPTVRSLIAFPMDLSKPPVKGTALDPALYTGDAIPKAMGEFNGMPIIGVQK